jgi:hypothetical protein
VAAEFDDANPGRATNAARDHNQTTVAALRGSGMDQETGKLTNWMHVAAEGKTINLLMAKARQ